MHQTVVVFLKAVPEVVVLDTTDEAVVSNMVEQVTLPDEGAFVCFFLGAFPFVWDCLRLSLVAFDGIS